jgi:thiazole synthase
MSDSFQIADTAFDSRLLTGSGKFSDGEVMQAALEASGSRIVTMALRRVEKDGRDDPIIDRLDRSRYQLLPNTSGVRTAKEAVFVAEMARDALQTNWVKLEIHPDPKYLMPDPVESLAAAEELVKRGFIVLPYVHADPVLCKRLEEVGTQAVMPLGAPIGSNRGLESRAFLEIIIEQASVPVIIDAGLGTPSHAAAAMEMGADAVLINTAIAAARDPVVMARAFAQAVEAGRAAYLAGLAPESGQAVATSPLTGFLSEAAAAAGG